MFSNFITQSLCKRLRLKQSPINMQIGVLGQLGPSMQRHCKVEIASKHGGCRLKIRYLVVNHITEDCMPSSSFSSESIGIPSHFKLADPSFNIPGQIDLLIGAEWFWDLLCVGQRKLNSNLIIQKIKFGSWEDQWLLPHHST